MKPGHMSTLQTDKPIGDQAGLVGDRARPSMPLGDEASTALFLSMGWDGAASLKWN